MPWCDTCNQYVKPDEVLSDDRCPDCSAVLDTSDQGESAVEEAPSAPWHFKLMLALLVAYLGWRVVQFVVWLVEH